MTPEKKPVNQLIKSPLVLCLITVAMVLVVTLVYQLTQPYANRREGESADSAMRRVMPKAATFSEVTNPEVLLNFVTNVYRALGSDGSTVGFVVRIAPEGYKGSFTALVGVTPEQTVSDVSILEHNETEGIGTKAFEAEYLERFKPKDAKVSAITGATITSTALAAGVDNAVSQVDMYLQSESQSTAQVKEGEVLP